MDLSVFDFDNYRDYLVKVMLPEGTYNQRGPNLSRWSERLGHKSPSLLSMVLSGQRIPSEELVETLVKTLKLQKNEADGLRLKVKLERLSKKKGLITQEVVEELNQLRERVGKIKAKSLDLSQFEAVAQWYCLAVKQLIATDDFIEDPEWIAKKLKNKLRPYQAKKAIEHLLDVGAIQRDEKGRLFVTHGVRTQNDIPSEAIVQHHLGMLEMAKEALREVPVERRQFNGLTFRVLEESIPQIKQDILNFIQEMNSKYSNDEGRDVFQLNMNFFELTDSQIRPERIQ